MRDSIEQVKLFDRDGVDLVKRVDNRDVGPVLGLEDIDQVVDRGVASNSHVRRRNLVLAQNRLDFLKLPSTGRASSITSRNVVTHVVVNMCQWDGAGDIDTALVFLLEDNVWRLLIDPDAEALELALDDLFICQRLVDIQHDEDEITRLGDCDNLSPSALAILGSLDDSRKIQNLDLGPIVHHMSGDRR